MKNFFVAMSFLLMITPVYMMPVKKQLTSQDENYTSEDIPLLLNAMPKIENFAYNNFEINVQSKAASEENKVNSHEHDSVVKDVQNNKRSELIITIDDLGAQNRGWSNRGRKNALNCALCFYVVSASVFGCVMSALLITSIYRTK